MDIKVRASAVVRSTPQYEVKSLVLSLNIVECIALEGDTGISVSEVARAVGTPKSNAYRILQTLCDKGYASDSGEGPMRRYRLGPSFLRLASATTTQRPVAELARPILKALSKETELTSRFAVLDHGYVIALLREAAPSGVQISPYLGQQEAAHCSGVGKALMSALPEDELKAVIGSMSLPRRTERTITDKTVMLAELKTARKLGFAIDDEEDFEGVFGIGSPVFDHRNHVVGGINASGLKLGRTHNDLVSLAKIVRRYALAFSKELGHSKDNRSI